MIRGRRYKTGVVFPSNAHAISPGTAVLFCEGNYALPIQNPVSF